MYKKEQFIVHINLKKMLYIMYTVLHSVYVQ